MVPNILISSASMIFFLAAVVLIYKFLGKSGIYVYVAFATILANIMASLSIEVLTLNTTAGSVLYASTFLSTDILSEKYGKKAAGKAVVLGVIVNLLWMAGTQVCVWLTPSPADTVHGAMTVLFGLVPRITLGSLTGYIFSQSIDVALYHFWWSKTGNSDRGLWIRNNGSTLISQLVDTVIFVTIAFIGTVPTAVFWEIMGTTYLFKAIIAVCDTPFAYIAKHIKVTAKEDD